MHVLCESFAQMPPHTGHGEPFDWPTYVSRRTDSFMLLRPLSTLTVPVTSPASFSTMQRGMPPIESGTGAPSKHSQTDAVEHVPRQSASTWQDLPFEHLFVAVQLPLGQSPLLLHGTDGA